MRRLLVPRRLILAVALGASTPACHADEAAARAADHDDFEQRKQARIATLRALHGLFAAEPGLIHALAQVQDVSAADRAHIAERLQIFQTRVDEADNAIESLAIASREDWDRRDAVATHAMERAAEARLDAWEALVDSKRAAPARTSMR